MEHYRRACAGAARVLELGCGAGRVTAHLAEAGRQTVGIDRDPELLALARQRHPRAAVHWLRADMRSFALAQRFERICIPHSGLYALLSEEDCRRCLRRVAEHLTPEGRLCFDLYGADHFHAEADPEQVESEELEHVTAIQHAGARYEVFERCRWQRAGQRLDVIYEYVPVAGGASLHDVVPQRYWLRGQVEPLLARCGLRLCSLAADFEGGDFGDEDLALVAEARLAR